MAALTALAHADIYPTGDFRLKSNSVSNCRKKLTDAHSVPDAVAAYQEWVNDEMGARAEDARADVQWTKVHGHHLSISIEWLDKRRHDHVALGRGYWLERRNEQWQGLLAL